ncbi:MAG: SRPBCC domain-containing protein [Hyphomonadaceae bacterium]|nr:SRPBCC domain-containing protein [Hyphomonadaceae bacterium]
MPASAGGSEPEADRTVVITRVFDAPARLLFMAYSKPEHIMKWFGPKGWPVTLCEMDFRKGGRFRMAMTGPSGKQNTPFGGEYLEIVRNRKIVYDNAFETPGAEKMVVTVTFEEKDGKTKLTIRTLFGSVAMKNEHMGMGYEQGVNSGLDQLADVVAAMDADGAGRPVIASTFITLDGYMVGPDEDMSWVIAGFDPQLQADIAEFMSAKTDTFIFGRNTYEIFAAYWPTAVPYEAGDALQPAAGKEDPRIIRALNGSPKIVFSQTLAPPTWGNTRVVRDDLEEEIRRLKRLSGKAISIQGSASIVQALERADLIDEYLLYIHPVLLGRGKPLFASGVSRQDFERVDLKPYANGVVVLRYRRKAATADAPER